MQNLSGKVALVTIGTRGMGRGIAYVLGEQGATVYFTERRTPEDNIPDTLPIPEQSGIVDTTPQYPKGIGLGVNHTDEAEVEAMVQRIVREQGRVDILVNSYCRNEEYDYKEFVQPFWEKRSPRWETMFLEPARANFLLSRAVAPIMIAQKSGLIINTTFYDAGKYLGDLSTDVVKNASLRMAQGMARELRPFGVAAIALSHGLVRVEAILAKINSEEKSKNDPVRHVRPPFRHDPDFDADRTESAQYIGRAVAALAADPNVLEKSGQLLLVGNLANEYGFTDIDGRLIPPFVISE